MAELGITSRNEDMSTMSESAGRQTFSKQLDAVERGEEVAITRHGKVIAVLVSPHRPRARRASQTWHRADAIEVLLRQARSEPLARPALTQTQADNLVQSIDAQRGKH